MQNVCQKITKYFLYISAFLIPFYFFRFSVFQTPTNIFEIAVLISLTFYVIFVCCHCFSLTIDIKNDSNVSFFAFCFLIFAGVLAISIFISSDKTKALGIAKGWFVFPAIFGYLIYQTFDKKTFARLSIPLFVSLILVSIWALLQKVGIISTLFYQVGDSSFRQYLSQGRIFGPFESPDFLAMFLAPIFFLSLPILDLIKQKSFRSIIWLLFLLPLLAIYFSGSRGGIIATAICVFVYLNYRWINHTPATKLRPFHQTLFAAILILANATYLFFATKLINASSGGDKIRVEIYKYSISMLKANWLFGVGLGNFQNKIGQISAGNFSFQQFALPYALHPHNLLLAIWLNLGIIGFAAFVYLITIFFKNAFNSTNFFRAALVSAMFAILIHGFFDTTYFKNDLSAIFWLVIFGSFILSRKTNENLQKN